MKRWSSKGRERIAFIGCELFVGEITVLDTESTTVLGATLNNYIACFFLSAAPTGGRKLFFLQIVIQSCLTKYLYCRDVVAVSGKENTLQPRSSISAIIIVIIALRVLLLQSKDYGGGRSSIVKPTKLAPLHYNYHSSLFVSFPIRTLVPIVVQMKKSPAKTRQHFVLRIPVSARSIVTRLKLGRSSSNPLRS